MCDHSRAVASLGLLLWLAHLDGGYELAHNESTDDEIAAACLELDGQAIQNVKCEPKFGRTRFHFDLGGVLETAPYDDELLEQWMLYLPNGNVYTYRSDGAASFGPEIAICKSGNWAANKAMHASRRSAPNLNHSFFRRLRDRQRSPAKYGMKSSDDMVDNQLQFRGQATIKLGVAAFLLIGLVIAALIVSLIFAPIFGPFWKWRIFDAFW